MGGREKSREESRRMGGRVRRSGNTGDVGLCHASSMLVVPSKHSPRSKKFIVLSNRQPRLYNVRCASHHACRASTMWIALSFHPTMGHATDLNCDATAEH